MNKFGCIFLEEGIDFNSNEVHDCCISHNDGRGLPVLIKDYNGEIPDWEKIFEIKDKRIREQKQATIYDCENCYHLSEYSFKGIHKISQFHFDNCRLCNAKCIYCSDETNSGSRGYDVYPVIKDLIDKGYYLSGGEATMQGGEPTLMQNFEALTELFIKNGTKIRVHTSAISYSTAIENALKNDMASIVVSIDSGSEEVYKQIKQVDAFNTVINNLSKYFANAKNKENIVAKYIIIPGVNDTVKEIDNFFDCIKKLGINTIAIDLEVQYARKYNNKDISKHIFVLYDYFCYIAQKSNIKLLTYSFISYVLNNRTFKQYKNFYPKFFLNSIIKCLTDRSKNICYKRKQNNV